MNRAIGGELCSTDSEGGTFQGPNSLFKTFTAAGNFPVTELTDLGTRRLTANVCGQPSMSAAEFVSSVANTQSDFYYFNPSGATMPPIRTDWEGGDTLFAPRAPLQAPKRINEMSYRPVLAPSSIRHPGILQRLPYPGQYHPYEGSGQLLCSLA